MTQYSLSESEEIVMQAIWAVWDGENPVTTKQFMPRFADQGWTMSATFTFMRRLENKGFLRAERSPNSRRENVYFPLISKEQWQYEQGKTFVSKMYGGMSNFILHFANNPNTTSAEIDELQRILDNLRNK